MESLFLRHRYHDRFHYRLNLQEGDGGPFITVELPSLAHQEYKLSWARTCVDGEAREKLVKVTTTPELNHIKEGIDGIRSLHTVFNYMTHTQLLVDPPVIFDKARRQAGERMFLKRGVYWQDPKQLNTLKSYSNEVGRQIILDKLVQ